MIKKLATPCRTCEASIRYTPMTPSLMTCHRNWGPNLLVLGWGYWTSAVFLRLLISREFVGSHKPQAGSFQYAEGNIGYDAQYSVMAPMTFAPIHKNTRSGEASGVGKFQSE